MTIAEPATDGDVLHFDLDWRDALAWERADPGSRRRGRVAVAASLFAGIGLLQVIGSHLASLQWLHSIPAAAVLIVTPAFAVLLLQRQARGRRARARFPAPVQAAAHLSPTRVILRVEGQSSPVTIGAKSLREVVVAKDHVFLTDGSEVAILPARAFGSAVDHVAFAEGWRRRLDD